MNGLMPTIRLDAHPEDYLETSHRTFYFRKVKFMLTVIDIVIAVTLAIIVSIIYGLQVKPFFLPLDVVLFAMGLVIFMVFIKSTAFKLYELKHAESSSNKLIMVKRIISWSFTTLVVCLVLCLIFVPYTTPALRNVVAAKWEGELGVNETTKQMTFGDRDNLGTVTTGEVEVKLISGSAIQFTVYQGEGVSGSGIPSGLTNPGSTMIMPIQHQDGYHSYTIVFHKTVNESVKVGYTLKAQVSSLYSLYDPLLALSFVFACIPIIVYCESQKKKYMESSIYEHL
jgi:hypothetical protein